MTLGELSAGLGFHRGNATLVNCSAGDIPVQMCHPYHHWPVGCHEGVHRCTELSEELLYEGAMICGQLQCCYLCAGAIAWILTIQSHMQPSLLLVDSNLWRFVQLHSCQRTSEMSSFPG